MRSKGSPALFITSLGEPAFVVPENAASDNGAKVDGRDGGIDVQKENSGKAQDEYGSVNPGKEP
jgi:hypothetical protein